MNYLLKIGKRRINLFNLLGNSGNNRFEEDFA